MASLSGCAVSKPAPVVLETSVPIFSSQHAKHLLDTALVLQSQGRYAASQEQLEQALGEISLLVPSEDSSLKVLTGEILGAMRNNLPYSLSPEGTLADDEYDGQMLLDSIDKVDLADGMYEGLDSATAARYRAEAMLDTGIVFDLPVELNDRVLVQLRTFKERIPSTFQRWLERKGRWEQEFTAKLAARGMPQDLIYLAMIESGFNSRATSPAAATGIWQFIPSTGRRYGLRVDRFVDERRDPWKATDAALDFLSALYLRFGDWRLAMAAYNCGEGCVDRAIRRAGHNNYWQLPIPNETRNYVPRVFAAAILGKRPDVHGFQFTPWQPLVADTFTVEGGISLLKIAEVVGTPAESLALLNPALIKGTTPPAHESWTLRLPPGTRPRLDSAYLALERTFEAPEPVRLVHRVRRGETLAKIARKYGVPTASLKSWNKIRGKKVRTGRSLVVYADDLSIKLPSWQEPPMERRSNIASRSFDQTPRHTVARGETIQKIARRYGVSVSDLMVWNALSSSKVRRGRRLLLAPPPDDPTLAGIPRTAVPEPVAEAEPQEDAPTVERPTKAAAVEHHEVRRGESLGRIARRYGVSIDDLVAWNDLPSHQVKAGKRLVVSEPRKRAVLERVASASPRAQEPAKRSSEAGVGTHRIRRGETISSIALHYGVSESELLAANGLKGPHVRAGQKLVIPSGQPVVVARRGGSDAVVVAARPAPRIEAQPVDRTIRTTRYTVRPGDTLYSIARAMSTTVDTLKQLNGLSKGDIRVGQVIKVPHSS